MVASAILMRTVEGSSPVGGWGQKSKSKNKSACKPCRISLVQSNNRAVFSNSASNVDSGRKVKVHWLRERGSIEAVLFQRLGRSEMILSQETGGGQIS